MPALFTHHLFALAFAKKHTALFPFLFHYQSLLTLGSQGPDPFFFYGQFPFIKRLNKEKIVDVGSFLHHEDPAINLLALIQGSLTVIQNYPNHSTMIITYVLGAISHYVLDRTMHPYVFYRSGFNLEGRLTSPYHADHADLESNIDLALMTYFSVRRSTMHPQATLRVEPTYVKMISTLYEKVYPQLNLHHDSYALAVNDMQSIYQFLFDRIGFKKTIWTWLAGHRSVPAALSHSSGLNQLSYRRVLNLDHLSWKNPSSQVVSQMSVPELFEDALQLMDRFVQLVHQGLNNQSITLSQLEALVEGINYDGHVFTDKMKTFDSYYSSYRGSKTSQ